MSDYDQDRKDDIALNDYDKELFGAELDDIDIDDLARKLVVRDMRVLMTEKKLQLLSSKNKSKIQSLQIEIESLSRVLAIFYKHYGIM